MELCLLLSFLCAVDDVAAHNCWLLLQPCSETQLCCLPYAHLLGVSKCGTTDLYARLAMHPLVMRTANKGPHFWDERWMYDPHLLPPAAITTYPHTFRESSARRRVPLFLRCRTLLAFDGDHQITSVRDDQQAPF